MKAIFFFLHIIGIKSPLEAVEPWIVIRIRIVNGDFDLAKRMLRKKIQALEQM